MLCTFQHAHEDRIVTWPAQTVMDFMSVWDPLTRKLKYPGSISEAVHMREYEHGLMTYTHEAKK